MGTESGEKAVSDRPTRPGVGSSAVDARIREQAVGLARELEARAQLAYADIPPDFEAECPEIKVRLDQKRKELQEHLDLGEELRHRLQVLNTIPSPEPDELRVRVLIIQGSLYDFTRLGKAGLRERLDLALQNAAQLLKERTDIDVILGQPEVVARGDGTWELTPEELWQIGERCATEGTPALLFADRILMPDNILPHSWGQADHSIACIAENEWVDGGKGLITAHNLAHLAGLDDTPDAPGLMSHDQMDGTLTDAQIERVRERVAERATRWAEESAAACQESEAALDTAQRTVVLLERQGDLLWQLYQTCLERTKQTPAHGVPTLPGIVSPTGRGDEIPAPDLSRLAQTVERLAQQIAQAEKELAAAKEILAELQDLLREISS